MKKIQLLSLAALILFGVTNLKAQEEVNYLEKKNELNLQVDNIFSGTNFYSMLYVYDYDDLITINSITNTKTIGIGYKYHNQKGAFRMKLSFGTFAQAFSHEEDDENIDKYAYHQEMLSAGYEFHSNLGRTQIFFGVDGTFGIQMSKVTSYYDYTLKESNEMISKSASISYGIRPFLGFKYFISPKFSVSSEYHIHMERTTGKNTYSIDQGNERETVYSSLSTKFGPMGQLTFSFHF